jgi:5-methylcytosine-specific restriction endonuclease McrA
MNAPTKSCAKCGEIKPLTDFAKDQHKADGITSRCKECRNAVRRQPTVALPDGFRRCSACNLLLPGTSEYFTPQKERADGFVSECRSCRNERGRLDRLKHPDKAKQYVKRYYDKNPEVYKEKGERRRAQKEALAADFTNKHWQYGLQYFYGACAYCGNGPSLFDRNYVLHQEHYIPLTRKGGYTPTNIVPACQDCNFKKHGKNPEQWIMQRFGKRKGEVIVKRIHAYFEWIVKQE